jgi:hypothetical protein
MDPPATADPASSTHSTLRKRLLVPIDTSSRGGGDWSRDPRSERASKVQEAEGSMAPEPPAGDEVEGRDVEAGEPMSPAGRLFRERHFNCYIVAMIGLGAAVDVAAARDGARPAPALLQCPGTGSSLAHARRDVCDPFSRKLQHSASVLVSYLVHPAICALPVDVVGMFRFPRSRR